MNLQVQLDSHTERTARTEVTAGREPPFSATQRMDVVRRLDGLALILRVSCFVSIAVGILSLLSLWAGQAGGAIRMVLVAPDDALGLIFMGFAVRMSRLEAHRRTIRIVVQTSRVCLVLLGASALAGLHLVWFLPPQLAGAGSPEPGMATGGCYLAIGVILTLKNRLSKSRLDTVMTALLCTFLGSCWVSLFLARATESPTPAPLRMAFLPLVILTAIGYVLSTATRTPGVLRVLAERGPEAEAARVMFPLAFVIPLLLAILRHQAEVHGLLQRDLGLLLHVLLSAGSMTGMIVWNANRIHSTQRIRESAEAVVDEMAAQYRDVFAVVRDPVWIFSAMGHLEFRNEAAARFSPTGAGPGDMESALGAAQQRAILSAALLGNRVREMELRDLQSGGRRHLEVAFLRVLQTPQGEPGSIILLAKVLPPKGPEGVQALGQALQPGMATGT